MFRIELVGAALALTFAIGLVSASSAGAAAISHGTITVGRGVDDARLDMTREQVISKLGAPVVENDNGVLSYQPDDDSARGIFDVYRHFDTLRVRMFVIAGFRGRGWKLNGGNAIFTRGAIDRLYNRYGRRVKRRYDRRLGERSYVIRSRYVGRPVETLFSVDRFSREKARVHNVFILFTDRGA